MAYSESRYDDITPALGAYYTNAVDDPHYTNVCQYLNYARYIQRYAQCSADNDCAETYSESARTATYGLACFEYVNYFNCHDKAGKWPNTGVGDLPLTWATPELVPGEPINATISKIKETRDKIGVLDQQKWRPDPSTPSLTGVEDSTFDDSNSNTPELVNSSQYETLRAALQTLYNSFTTDPSKTDLDSNFTTVLPEPSGSASNATDINLLRAAITQIANSCYEAYANYLNYTAAATKDVYTYSDANLRVAGYFNAHIDYNNYTKYSEYNECSDYTKYTKSYSDYSRYQELYNKSPCPDNECNLNF